MSIQLYIRELAADMPKREAERVAASQLADEAGIGQIRHTTEGAPVVDRTGVYISISHNRNTCVLAVSDAPVGVDIESARPKLATVVARVSSPEEIDIDPLHLWTAKEAVFKCAGIPNMVISQVIVSPTLQTATALGHTYNLQYHTHNDALICTAQVVKG